MLRLILLLVAVGLLGAWLTRPSEDQAKSEMRATIIATLTTEDTNGKDPVTSAALMGCRMNPEGCYDLVSSGLKTTYEDRTFYSVFTATGFDRSATCYGAFTKFTCPGGFAPQ
ncbi:hypothetical protein P775_16280 [Puniceibacterium antarcticum]|uniref:Uncharacterized protein n=1 Tax=Puniceibacterium antarcticum TaxID=1206336 RepID=A0A2G8RDF9_9RHOB|nr:hypothetical protein [Puniceibacterium antarcticum]PIL19138.1 hypothetical protein P775_16280 [Puniceibacterium antarcticum]